MLIPYYFGIVGNMGNPYIAHVQHPSVDSVTYFHEPFDPDATYEIAFHKDHAFVLDLMDGFEQYAEPAAGDTRVYRYVPRQLVHDFINNNS